MAKPLTKRDKEGSLYTRPAEVEANIDGALFQDTAELIRRARVDDRASSDYLTSECLVHLIRAAIRCGDDERFNTLLPILMSRCEANLESTVRRSVPNAELIREEVVSQFGVLFAREAGSDPPNSLDYYECKFDSAFRTLRICELNREIKRIQGFEVLSDGSEAQDGQGRPPNLPECRPTQEDAFHLADLSIYFDRLPEKVRKVVALKELGLAIGSDDYEKDQEKCKDTIAARCKVSGRTVRERLGQARKQLEQMRQEES